METLYSKCMRTLKIAVPKAMTISGMTITCDDDNN